jgi:hypothetical protein
MTIQQMQKLSELTTAAAEKNDIATLQKIKSIIDQDIEENGIEQTFGIEWFESSLNGEQLAELK